VNGREEGEEGIEGGEGTVVDEEDGDLEIDEEDIGVTGLPPMTGSFSDREDREAGTAIVKECEEEEGTDGTDGVEEDDRTDIVAEESVPPPARIASLDVDEPDAGTAMGKEFDDDELPPGVGVRFTHSWSTPNDHHSDCHAQHASAAVH
jgi:hypothetical protein